MSAVWVVSSVLAWLVIALLVAVVLSLMRQVAELRGRVEQGAEELPWLDAEDDRPVEGQPGTAVAAFTVSMVPSGTGDVDRPQPVTLGGEQPAATMLLFQQPGCPSCEGLDEALASAVGNADAPVHAMTVVVLDDAEAYAHLQTYERPLPAIPVGELPPELQRWTTPALLGISAAGVIRLDGHPRGPEGLADALGVVTAAEPAA